MAAQVPQIKTESRDRVGSRYAKRLRSAGQLPAVIYGHGHDPVHVSMDARAFGDILETHAHVVEVVVDGHPQPCLLKDVQYDHLDRTPIHADLAIVNLDEEVEVEVGLELIGEAVGLKVAGAMLDQQHTEVSVRCKARDIPEVLTHDISGMNAGDILHASDLVLPECIQLAMDQNTIIALIEVRADQVEEAPVAESEAAEPEVIAKGKKEEEGAPADAKGGKAAAPAKK